MVSLQASPRSRLPGLDFAMRNMQASSVTGER
jgi:hypothetical protein